MIPLNSWECLFSTASFFSKTNVYKVNSYTCFFGEIFFSWFSRISKKEVVRWSICPPIWSRESEMRIDKVFRRQSIHGYLRRSPASHQFSNTLHTGFLLRFFWSRALFAPHCSRARCRCQIASVHTTLEWFYRAMVIVMHSIPPVWGPPFLVPKIEMACGPGQMQRSHQMLVAKIRRCSGVPATQNRRTTHAIVCQCEQGPLCWTFFF